MSRWFRHYAGMMRDDKLVRVAIKCGQPIERVLWIWGAILESAAEIDDNGRYDVDAAEIAYFLRADNADAVAVLDALADAGRVAENCVVHWGQRQFQSDRSNARVAAFRERKKDAGSDRNVKKTKGNGRVTLPKRYRNSPETETETDNNPLTPLQGELPDWVPVSDWMAFREMRKAIKKPMTNRAVELALLKLCDLRKDGHNPSLVLQQSTLNCWQDIYPPKKEARTSEPVIGV